MMLFQHIFVFIPPPFLDLIRALVQQVKFIRHPYASMFSIFMRLFLALQHGDEPHARTFSVFHPQVLATSYHPNCLLAPLRSFVLPAKGAMASVVFPRKSNTAIQGGGGGSRTLFCRRQFSIFFMPFCVS